MKKCVSSVVTVAALTLAGGSALAQDAQQLLKDKGCLVCHAIDKKVVGPAYKDVAAKYRSRKDAEGYLVKKIEEGSSGVWGQIPMPPNTTVSQAEAHTLAKYLLKLK